MRRAILYFEKWLIYSVIVGIATALIIVLFYKLILSTTTFFAWIIGTTDNPLVPCYNDFSLAAINSTNKLLIPVSLLIGTVIGGLIVYYISPEAEGPGVDATIEAFHKMGGIIRSRVPFMKTIASAFAVGSGCSGGLLGPSVQIGAGIGSLVADTLKAGFHDRRMFLVAGMAGALSAIFRTPIGAAIFAMEVLYQRDFETRAFLPVIISSLTSYTVSYHLIGFTEYFPRIDVELPVLYNVWSFISIILLSLFATPIALLFNISFVKSKDFFEELRMRLGMPRILKPILGVSLLAPIGIMFPEVLGSGRGFLNSLFTEITKNPIIIENMIIYLAILTALKIIATCLSIGSGNSGGVFAPGLYIGALTGLVYAYTIATKISALHPIIYAYISMAIVFGAISKTPLATSIMIGEMTNNYHLIVPSLLASTLARELTGTITIYRSQKVSIIKHSLQVLETVLSKVKSKGINTQDIKAKDIAIKSIRPLNAKKRLSDIIEYFNLNVYGIIPIVNDKGFIVGVIDATQYYKLIELPPHLTLESVDLEKPVIVSEDDSIDDIVDLMVRYNRDYVLVTSHNNIYKGVITIDIILSTLLKIVYEKETKR